MIVEDLFHLKNESWLQEEEKPLTKEEFWEMVQLQSLSFDGDGDFEVWFINGDTFCGHSICMYGNLNGKLNQAVIH